MARLKKIVKITAIVLCLLIGLAFAAPYLFKGKIISLVKTQINNKLNAKTEFSDVSISFFRHFPKVSVSIKDLQITGLNEFAADTLVAAKTIDLSLNLISVIRGSDYELYAIDIIEPRIHAIVSEEGKKNWDIAKRDTAEIKTTIEEPYKLSIRHYSINNACIQYDDAVNKMSGRITNMDHEGSGDFTSDLFTLKTKTSADAVSFTYGGIPYLFETRANILADLQVDNKTNTYNIKAGDIGLNDLKIAVEGFFRLMNDSTYDMNIRFKTASTDFKNILSLIPAVYKNDFSKITTSGKLLFDGFVKGQYSNTRMPAYNLNLEIANGYFKYPDLPKPVKNINLQLKVENPDGLTDHTSLNIPSAHIELDEDPFDFRLLLKSPVTDRYIDASAKGKLDLSKISQLIKLEAGTKLMGLLNADLAINGNQSAIENKQYERFHASGSIDLNNFLYQSRDYPDGVKLDKLLMTFSPKNVTVSNLAGQYLNTNFSGNGSINNLLPYILKNEMLDASMNLKADHLNLNQLMGVPDTSAAATASSTPFAVPSNMHLLINSNIEKVHYDKVDLENVSGNLQIADETVRLNNVKANALGGTMAINGSYSTKQSKKNPDISLAYDVKGLDVQKTFFAFNTLQKLMPVGEYLSGKLSSQLNFTGKLGENMMPDLASLTGQGNLLLIEGFLNKFTPVEKLAQTLNVKELEAISLKDVKNYIEFNNGRVLVKPFKLKVKNIDMEIGGMHGFDQSLDYSIQMKIPRAMMGEKGNQFVNNLISQVSNKGVPVQLSEFVDLNVKMGGFIKNPTLKTDLKQSAGKLADEFKLQATAFAKQKIDSTRTAAVKAVKDTIASTKKQMLAAAQDELKKQLFKKDTAAIAEKNSVDLKKNLGETGKGLIENFNPFRKKKKQTDSLKKN